jgi:hypothetical protein
MELLTDSLPISSARRPRVSSTSHVDLAPRAVDHVVVDREGGTEGVELLHDREVLLRLGDLPLENRIEDQALELPHRVKQAQEVGFWGDAKCLLRRDGLALGQGDYGGRLDELGLGGHQVA